MKDKKKNDRIYNVAVIGAGGIGIDHITSFQKHPNARVVAIAETSAARGSEAAELHNIPEVVTDYKKLIAHPGIDVISIALPNYLHAPVALAALRAGKHVMIDKPMATRAADAARLVAEARNQKRLLMVGQNNRFTPEVQTAKKLIADGVPGDVYHAKTAWTRRAGIPRIGSWFTQKKYASGGATYDIGVHALDRCLYLMGEFDAAAVSGQTYSKFGPRGLGDGNWGKGEIDPSRRFDVDDLSVALIKLKSGRTVLLEASWAAHQPAPDFNGTQLFGTDAGILFPPLQLFRDTPRGYVTELVKTSAPYASTNRMTHFIDCLLGKAEPYVKPAESLAVQKILDAIYLSAKTGKEVRVK
ncbi:Gfo/Idh/MocA family protein [Ereboglobus luteus]|uniref:Oxidoreductase n=1 Tax=Ereboglobus luteus TaxID=1796921 RepID=A0A2U8E3E8_9BACT|nr:Gfo/Idh/MocA family oxidoreductase [Ereboglobus luteus]AWI09341.1 oxidoreductase [Ereboglobus luteus]